MEDAEQAFAERRMPVAPHHDQVRIICIRLRRNRLADRPPFSRDRCHLNAHAVTRQRRDKDARAVPDRHGERNHAFQQLFPVQRVDGGGILRA